MMRISSQFQNVKSFFKVFKIQKNGAQHESPHAKQTFESPNYPRNISISSEIGKAFEKKLPQRIQQSLQPRADP